MRFLERKAASFLRALPLRGRPALLAERVATRLTRPAPPAAAAVDDLRELGAQRARRMVPVTQPLVLVSQIHRSGGTLLSRLFDGHPELYAVPHELGPLIPSRPLPVDPDAAWNLVYDPKLPGRFARGLRQSKRHLNQDESDTEFLLPPTIHRRLYNRHVRLGGAGSPRELMDAYVTGYFNAWLDYRGGRKASKRWVTGFEPSLIAQPRRVEQYRALYPDGRVISIVREPGAWFSSARRWDERYARLELALTHWLDATEAIVHTASELGDAMLVLDFDDLVDSTAETMARVASFLEIEFREELLQPTVNGVPFGANSSFESGTPGVVESRAGRAAELSNEERLEIDRVAGDAYLRFRERAAAS